MKITQIDSQVLRIPVRKPLQLVSADDHTVPIERIILLVVHIDTDAGHRGFGFAYSIQGGGRALKVAADDDLTPLLMGENPLDHERLGQKVRGRLLGVGRHGLLAQAYSAFDLALWDIKGKAAGLPLYRLLGGARESAPIYVADTGFLWMSAEETIAATRPYLEKGLMGLKVHVGVDPEADADRLARIREALGEDIWLGVDAFQRYDYTTALSMGRFFEEEIGADWFEEPIQCEDVAGHAMLAEKLDIPLAVGESLYSAQEFRAYLDRDAAAILQPDVTRIGGLTNWLKVAALAEMHQRPIAPHILPEVGVHLACGLPSVVAVEYMPWLFPAFVETPSIVNGRLVPLPRPGLGLEIDMEAVDKYRLG